MKKEKKANLYFDFLFKNKNLLKSKHAQVTIFIIIAIVIVVAAGTIMYLTGGFEGKFLDTQENEIYSYVEDCLEQTAVEVIYLIGEKGGYYFEDSYSLPYYYADGKAYVPIKEQIEQEISNGINFELPFCTDFKAFSDYQINQGEVETQTRIFNNEIILNINYPLTITKGDDVTSFKNFRNIKIPIRLGIIHSTINEIIQDQLKNEKYSIDGEIKEAYCLTCINDIAIKNNLLIDIIEVEEDEQSVIFAITDENSKINEETFTFMFANKYQVESI